MSSAWWVSSSCAGSPTSKESPDGLPGGCGRHGDRWEATFDDTAQQVRKRMREVRCSPSTGPRLTACGSTGHRRGRAVAGCVAPRRPTARQGRGTLTASRSQLVELPTTSPSACRRRTAPSLSTRPLLGLDALRSDGDEAGQPLLVMKWAPSNGWNPSRSRTGRAGVW